MATKRRLSHDDRIKIVILREEGYSMEAIAAELSIGVGTGGALGACAHPNILGH